MGDTSVLIPDPVQAPADPAQEKLNQLYPSMGTVQRPTVKTPAQEAMAQAKTEGVAITSMPEELVGLAKFGRDPGEGDPAADYTAHGLSDFYDQLIIDARGIKDDDGIALLQQSKDATNQAFKDYYVGPVRAKEIMMLAKKYHGSDGADNLEQVNANFMTKFRAEEGTRTDKLLAGAQKVTADLCKRIPGFKEIVDKGLGSNETFIRAMINAAVKKGWA